MMGECLFLEHFSAEVKSARLKPPGACFRDSKTASPGKIMRRFRYLECDLSQTRLPLFAVASWPGRRAAPGDADF
jgi:hypothetical protein